MDAAREDFKPAANALFEVLALVEAGGQTEFADRWPETLAAFGSFEYPAMRDAGRELAYHLYLRQARGGADSGSEAWRRQIEALAGLARFNDRKSEAPASEDFTTAPRLGQWRPASNATARSRGSGYPRAHWQAGLHRVDIFAGHQTDFLYFQSPLRGNYEVECDTPAFAWRDTQVVSGGRWVAAIYDLKSQAWGDFRTERGRRPISPPLTKPQGVLHYRIVMRDGVRTTYVNGRRLHEERLPPGHDPWLAVRSPVNNTGFAENFRIQGAPQIPAELQLSPSDDLSGWAPYYQNERIGGPSGVWLRRVETAQSSGDYGGEFVGRRRAELNGSALESLLQYHRAMFEDGAIEYEFFYREGESHCHPALDRLCFLLDPAGVRIHWLTDGAFDRTALAPNNASDEPQNRRGPQRLPLLPGAWNRLGVSLRGDTVQLRLNGQLVYERDLEATNRRAFGLFHYADRTEARVRNVTWRGDWPRELPPVAEQELSGPGAEELDARSPPLTAVFEHDFARDGLPSRQFSMIRGTLASNFFERPDGLLVQKKGGAGYDNASLAPLLRVGGDFDITARYDHFKPSPKTDSTASLVLNVQFGNQAGNECRIYHFAKGLANGGSNLLVQTALIENAADGERRLYSRYEAYAPRGGALRLSRRGDTVYFLISENDSPNFRLLRTETVTRDDVQMDGVNLIASTNDPSQVEAIWKSLTVRAERLSGLAVEDRSKIVAELDRQRNALPARFVHDFTRDAFTDSRFHHWAFQPPAETSPRGLVVRAPAADKWVSAGAAPHIALRGDFDISLAFDALKIDAPKPKMNSAVYLQIELPIESQLHCNVILVVSEDGSQVVRPQLASVNADGSRKYRSLHRATVKNVRRMRIARRGKQMYFLYSEDPSQPDHLLDRCEVPDAEVADGLIRLMVHTGGADRVTEIAWRRFSAQAGAVATGAGEAPPSK